MSPVFTFDKAVPIPTTTVRQGVNIDMLKSMDIGDSKWWPVGDEKKATRFYRVAKKLDIAIVIRKVGEGDPRGAGIRLWRVDPTAKGDLIAAAEKAAAKKAVAPKKAAAKVSPKKAAPKKAAPKKPARRSTDPIPSTPAFKKQQATKVAPTVTD